MNALIDRERMLFVAKHRNAALLSNIAHIEVAHSATVIIDCDTLDAFRVFTDLELRLLFINTTGEKNGAFLRVQLLNQAWQIAQLIDETIVDAFELQIQANLISFNDQGKYRYVAGSRKPAIMQELFERSGLQLSKQQTLDAKKLVVPESKIHYSSSSDSIDQSCFLNFTKPENIMAKKDATKTELTADQKAAATIAKREAAEKAAADKKAAAEKAAAEKAAALAKEKADKEAAKAAKAEADAKAKAEKEAAKAAKAEASAKAKAEKEAKKLPESNGTKRPGANTTGGRIWQVIDDESTKLGRPVSITELKAVPSLAADLEVNIRSIYARWRKFNGVTGRVETPAPVTATV